MSTEERLVMVVWGVVMGVVYGLYGYFTKADKGEKLNVKKVLRTSVIWGAAGALVGAGGDRVTEQSVQETMSQTAIIGVVFDMLWSRLARQDDTSGDGVAAGSGG